MTNLDPHIEVVVIEKDPHHGPMLSTADTMHKVSLAHDEDSAMNVVNKLHDEGRTLNLVVILDTKVYHWAVLLKRIYDLVPIAQIIVVDEEEFIDQSVIAFRNGAWEYNEYFQSADDLIRFINSSQDQVMSQKKMDDLWYKDNQREPVKEESETDTLIKSLRGFESIKAEREQHLGTKAKEDKDLLDLFIMGLKKGCTQGPELYKKVCEYYFQKPLSELKKGKLLLVEDEAQARFGLKATLTTFYDFHEAEDAKMALDKVKTESPFDQILLDVHLPDENGNVVFPKLREIDKEAITTVLTAYKEIDIARDLIHKGAYNYLNKPVDLQDMWNVMGRTWIRRAWPFFEGKYEIVEQDILRRVYLLDHLVKQRGKDGIYINDVYALIPELYQLLIPK